MEVITQGVQECLKVTIDSKYSFRHHLQAQPQSTLYYLSNDLLYKYLYSSTAVLEYSGVCCTSKRPAVRDRLQLQIAPCSIDLRKPAT